MAMKRGNRVVEKCIFGVVDAVVDEVGGGGG